MSETAPQRRPGIDIRPLDTVEAVHTASAVLSEVWGGDRTGMPPNLLRALEHAGNYAVGLYDGDRMIGASVAFYGAPGERTMHSHITGVLHAYRSQGLGRVLKQHQREWALAREVGNITWTFDPLVARNAHFNLAVLGVRVTEFLVNYYGAMDDGVNRGDESDRLMVCWAVAAAPVRTPEPDRVRATVEVPRDIQALRKTNPDEAREWRFRLREEFEQHLGAGLRIGGFDADRGGYLFTSTDR